MADNETRQLKPFDEVVVPGSMYDPLPDGFWMAPQDPTDRRKQGITFNLFDWIPADDEWHTVIFQVDNMPVYRTQLRRAPIKEGK